MQRVVRKCTGGKLLWAMWYDSSQLTKKQFGGSQGKWNWGSETEWGCVKRHGGECTNLLQLKDCVWQISPKHKMPSYYLAYKNHTVKYDHYSAQVKTIGFNQYILMVSKFERVTNLLDK